MSINKPALIAVEGIRIYARHGVFDYEKKRDQLFVVDLFITLAKPVVPDELSNTVDYSRLVEVVAEVFAQPPVTLIETLAQDLSQRVSRLRNVGGVKAVVHKPTVALARPIVDVSVTVEVTNQ